MTRPMTVRRLSAMATEATVAIAAQGPAVEAALEAAAAVFRRVEAACTRFDPGSPLMVANASPQDWHVLPREAFDAVTEAWTAHRATDGLFDPRILGTLLRLGYDRTLPFRSRAVVLPAEADAAGPAAVPVRDAVPAAAPPLPWRPEFDPARSAVRLGQAPIDLGGIGKGLAVRWAAAELSRCGAPYLVEAGWDCSVGGDGPDGQGWRIGVEDPTVTGASPPLVAVLRLADASCATSSSRVRTWRVGGRPVHHLIDPRTADVADGGLRAVTVVAADPALAEVWSKTLFLAGRAGIAEACARHGIEALWVDDDAVVTMTSRMRDHIIWEVDGADAYTTAG